MKKYRKAINFDLDTKTLQKIFQSKNPFVYMEGYRPISVFLKILGKFQIKVSAQAIQAENFSSAEEAFAALDSEEKAGTLEKNYKS